MELLDLFRLLLFGKKTVFTATVAIDFYKNVEYLDIQLVRLLKMKNWNSYYYYYRRSREQEPEKVHVSGALVILREERPVLLTPGKQHFVAVKNVKIFSAKLCKDLKCKISEEVLTVCENLQCRLQQLLPSKLRKIFFH